MGGDLLFYINKRQERLGEEKFNNQGCLMKIIEYNTAKDIIVEFQDIYKGKVHTNYKNYRLGSVKNPYFPTVYGVGMCGNKYPTQYNNNDTREYITWHGMLERCFYEKRKIEYPTYKNAMCCDEWLNRDNFEEWLRCQINYDKFLNGNFALDKDILFKGNKLYSPDTCCLVPEYVNTLFVKRDNDRGDLPIGVTKNGDNKFRARCNNPLIENHEVHIGTFNTTEEAFYAYKKYKESLIKEIAEIEYIKRNISKECYDAMMKYEVEITD